MSSCVPVKISFIQVSDKKIKFQISDFSNAYFSLVGQVDADFSFPSRKAIHEVSKMV